MCIYNCPNAANCQYGFRATFIVIFHLRAIINANTNNTFLQISKYNDARKRRNQPLVSGTPFAAHFSAFYLSHTLMWCDLVFQSLLKIATVPAHRRTSFFTIFIIFYLGNIFLQHLCRQTPVGIL